METRPPTISRILIAVGFAISCFALALFLWLAFGGPIPLKPEGYRLTVPFDEATQLAVESDVRISGVSVGKVKEIELNDQGQAEATIELDDDFAPVPSDTRAILRQKTLLGETYVELSQGSNDVPTLKEGGALPDAQVSEAVQLDEIFRTFDERTRAAFQGWMQGQAAAFEGRGDDFSVALASLDPFAQSADRTLRILDSQKLAVRQLVRDGGDVFKALSERQGQLAGVITNARQVFATTAARNQDLEQIFTILPTFLRESRLTLDRLEQFATETDPLVKQLQPAAKELSPTLISLGDLAPELKSFFIGLRGTIAAAPSGFSATRKLLDNDLSKVLPELGPVLAELNPLLTVVRNYRQEVAAFFANAAAATNAFFVPSTGAPFKYLRTTSPMNPGSLAAWPNKLRTDRSNPYVKPGGYSNLKTTLESFQTFQCSGGLTALLDPNAPNDPDFNARTGGDVAAAQDFFDRIKLYAYGDTLNSNQTPAPPCNPQAPFNSIGGGGTDRTQYQHVKRDG